VRHVDAGDDLVRGAEPVTAVDLSPIGHGYLLLRVVGDHADSGNLGTLSSRGSHPGQNLVRIGDVLSEAETPTRAALVENLKRLREKGLPEIDKLSLPSLLAAAQIVTGPSAEEVDEGAAIETLLRRTAARLGGGSYGDSVRALFGLDPETRVLTAGVRRNTAAEALGCSQKTFLRKHENAMLLQVAGQILVLCAEQHMRDGRTRLAAQHPVESGIAVHWIERFEAYYRLWSPIYGIGADLTAYRATLLEQPQPYDRRFGTLSPEDPGYSQDEQAEGYGRFALYLYTLFEWELRRFRALHGGLWLLSDADAEQAVSDAVYRIAWHINPFNERDQSFLRTTIDETPNQELHGFLERLASTDIGRKTHEEWQDWAATCACTWPPGTSPETDYFPTARNQPGISADCQVHQVVAACGLYCELIDTDWRKIADWYRFGDEIRKGVSAERLYAEWRSTPSGAEYKAPGA
jgi:hypothetical protein